MRLKAFWYAPANEVGDTLAGIAGSLAFLWLIVTVTLQGKELSAQRYELRLTREEIRDQRKATQDMAVSMAAQAGIFEDEKRQRREAEAWDEAEEIVENIKVISKSNFVRELEVHWSKAHVSGAAVQVERLVLSNALDSPPYDMIYQFSRRFQKIAHLVGDAETIIVGTSGEKQALEVLIAVLRRLAKVYPRLSVAKQIKIERSNVDAAIDALVELEELF